MRVFITGGTGQVGSNVIRAARDTHRLEVIASVFGRQPETPWNVETVTMDLEDAGSIRQAITGTRPDAVIHCAFPRDLDRLETDHEWAWRVMVHGTEAMARACREAGAKLVFISSDWVFGAGGTPPYREDSPPSPVNYYAVMKVVGETWVRALCENSAVARIGGVYGPNWSFPSRELTPEEAQENAGFGRLPHYIVSRLSRGLPVVVRSKRINYRANPSLASDIADATLAICRQDARGVFHCGGRESVDRLELALLVADTFGFDRGLVRAATEEEMATDAGLGEARIPPHDTRLSVAATEATLRRTNMGVRDGLKQYRRELQELGLI